MKNNSPKKSSKTRRMLVLAFIATAFSASMHYANFKPLQQIREVEAVGKVWCTDPATNTKTCVFRCDPPKITGGPC